MDHIITTPCGQLRGVPYGNGCVAYKGIRYATARRYEYPTVVTSWEGVYDVTEYGACAYQPRSFYNEEEMPKKIFYFNEFRRGREYTYSEDCLFLNVFAPEKGDTGMPVIVYIHGGGFTGGCGHERHFDGPVWPEKGVIGVTVNYRLGPLGFAAHPALLAETGKTGNYGLYDQLAALKWVRDNISAFGGDPGNVTIMGQSAGAMSVQQHCLSPLSRDYFHKAVMSSGGGLNKILAARPAKKSFAIWESVMEKCGAHTVDEIRNIPVEALFAAWREIAGRRGCFPVIDGELVVAPGHEILARGEQYEIPYMIGTTSEDMLPPLLFKMAKKWCAAQKDDAYLWFFERQLPGDDHGAWHSSDLWYWFGTLDNCWRPFTECDRALSDEMTDRLTAFAKTAIPNAPGLAAWPSGTTALTFGDGASAPRNPKALKLWHTMFTNKAPGE